MFFVALNDVAELARPLVILHLLSVPGWVALFSALFHIVVQLGRERFQIGKHLISLFSDLLLIGEHVIRCNTICNRHLHFFGNFVGRRLSFLSPPFFIFLCLEVIFYLCEISWIHLFGHLFQLVLGVLWENL